MKIVRIKPSFESFRTAARSLLATNLPPGDVLWETIDAQHPLLGSLGNEMDVAPTSTVAVPPRFIELARTVCSFRDDSKWPLLYRVLWRIVHGERELLSIAVDDDVN